MVKPPTQRREPRRGAHGNGSAAALVLRSQGGGRSLADAAYERIKLGIISLRYVPGAYVNEAQLCADLEFGRTPVHHAVMRLALDGLLEIVPRKGIIVSPISLNEIMASVEVRLINEPACARLVAERGTADEFGALAACLKKAEHLISARNIMGLMNADREFHSVLARASRNKLLEQILQRLHEQSLRFWFISLSDPAHLKGVDVEHWDVVRALQSRDAARAEEAMRAHIESFRDHIRASI
jgi:DNA-binding GntR family transcriptional regulator